MSVIDKDKGVALGDTESVHWDIAPPPPDFSHFENLLETGSRSSSHLTRRKRLISWIKERFIWVVYLTMIIQVGANVGVLTALPGILKSEVLYFRIPLTRHVINSQSIPMLAPCVINHLILGEWYFVRHRYHLQEGDMLGILGLLLLLVTAVSIDACRLIQSHLRLVELRRQDGKKDVEYNKHCAQTYVALAKDLDRITLTPVQNLIRNHQCCGKEKTLEESIALFPDLKKSFKMEDISGKGFRCCKDTKPACTCNGPDTNSMYSICLTKVLDEMSGVYSSTYPIYIVFVLASVSSILAFLHYNSHARNLSLRG